jgi:5-methylcytosine-specific restriction endonuclease McrA
VALAAPVAVAALSLGASQATNPATKGDIPGGFGAHTVRPDDIQELGENPLRHEGKNDPGSTDTHCTVSRVSASPGPSQLERETYYEVTIAADEEFMQLYQRVRAIQSIKAKPGEDIASTFKALMQEYITRHAPEEKSKRRAKRKKAQERGTREKETQKRRVERKGTHCRNAPSDRPNPVSVGRGKRGARTRHIPADVKDKVLARDNHRCTFIASDGVRCNAARHLQFDHVEPFARGGDHTLDNLRLLCAAHNRQMAEGMFGPRHGFT